MQSAHEKLEVLGPDDGKYVQIGAMGARFMVEAERGAGFSLVEHPIAPRGLAAPMHTHTHEDEYTYVLEGEVGVQIGDEVAVGKPGDLVFKPRGVPHAFWNAADAPARVLAGERLPRLESQREVERRAQRRVGRSAALPRRRQVVAHPAEEGAPGPLEDRRERRHRLRVAQNVRAHRLGFAVVAVYGAERGTRTPDRVADRRPCRGIRRWVLRHPVR